jgi:glutaredoxin
MMIKDLAARVLKIYDELGRESLDLHAMFEITESHSPEKQEEILNAVAELVGVGFLRAGEGGDFYSRTEDGRIRVAGPRDVTLYTREGCHLCDAAKLAMAPVLKEFGARLREVDIDGDPLLRQRYNDDVPVIFIGSREVARHKLDAAAFRRELQSAK